MRDSFRGARMIIYIFIYCVTETELCAKALLKLILPVRPILHVLEQSPALIQNAPHKFPAAKRKKSVLLQHGRTHTHTHAQYSCLERAHR